jgi:hypothetical protein
MLSRVGRYRSQVADLFEVPAIRPSISARRPGTARRAAMMERFPGQVARVIAEPCTISLSGYLVLTGVLQEVAHDVDEGDMPSLRQTLRSLTRK